MLTRCGSVDPGRQSRRTCRMPVAVSAGQVIGKLGGSGYGRNSYWGAHLHWEVRTFDTLGIGGDDASGTEVGYTNSHPDIPRTTRRRSSPSTPLHSPVSPDFRVSRLSRLRALMATS